MGTTYTIKVVDSPVTRDALARGVQSILDAVNAKMSTYRPDSELSRFNQHFAREPFPLSRETLDVMALALEVSRKTDGAYDITVGPLVNAWGFGPDGPTSEPTEQQLAELRARTGYQLLTLDMDAGNAQKGAAELYCDLSSIAKGHAVDRVALWLDGQGVRHYMVEVGGEVRTRGENKHGEAWQLGIRMPIPNSAEVYRTIALSGQSMATSGDYQNFYVRDGKRYSHIIDPRTGKPISSNTASVTVIAADCAVADAWATALTVLGPEGGVALANRESLSVLFVLREDDDTFTQRASSAFNAQFAAN